MQVFICDSNYDDAANIQDVQVVPFLNCRNPLYIGAKEGQVNRMKNAIAREKLGGTSLGFWELNTTDTVYLSKKGKLDASKFKEHDMVFLSNPSRVHEKYRAMYSELVAQIQALC